MKKNELINSLNEKYQKGLDNKLDAELNALVNINYINGKQYIRINKEKNIIEEITTEDSRLYKEKEIFNRMRPLRNTIITKIKDKIPEPQVVPYTQDDEDLDAAKATNAMLKDLFNRQKMNKKLKKAAIDTVDIGPAFLHVKWNPKAGKVLMSDLNSILGDGSGLLTFEQKEKVLKKLDANKELRSGDVEIEYVKMFEILVADAFEEDLNEQPWMMRVKAYSKEEAKAIYNIDFTETESVGLITNTAQKSSYMDGMLTENLGVYNSEEHNDMVVIKEYFEKPSALYPKGRHILFAGQHIISKEDELPYINAEYEERAYPFIKIGLNTKNLFYSHAFIEDQKAVQRRYNQTRNRKYEYITKNVHGQLAIQVGSVPDDEEISNKPGEIIWYNRSYAPPTTIKSNSTGTLDVDSELRSLENEFIQVTGISTLSTTGTPNTSAVRGASMVQTLLESDDSKFSLIIEELMEAVIEVSKQAIRLYKQFMLPNETRFSRFTKDSSTVINWNKNLLVEDIDIKNKSKLSTTDARRKDDIKQILGMGLLNADSPLGPDMTVKMLEQFDIGVSMNEMPIAGYADIKKARRENRLIVNNGAQIDADEFDDHEIHYSVHTNFLKSEEYRAIVIANPLIDEVFRAHIKQHWDIVSARQQQAQAQAIAQENLKNK